MSLSMRYLYAFPETTTRNAGKKPRCVNFVLPVFQRARRLTASGLTDSRIFDSVPKPRYDRTENAIYWGLES